MEKKMENEMETLITCGLWGLGLKDILTMMENQTSKKWKVAWKVWLYWGVFSVSIKRGAPL